MAAGQGQLSIIDYNDAVSVQLIFSSLLALTQRGQVDASGGVIGTYSPPWLNSAQKFTPYLFAAGDSATNQIATNPGRVTNIKWYEVSAAYGRQLIGAAVSVSAQTNVSPPSGGRTYNISTLAAGATLAIGNSEPFTKAMNSLTYICELDYTDPTTLLVLHQAVSFNCVAVFNEGNATGVTAWAPNGDTFRNATPTSLLLQMDTYRAGIIDTDYTNQAYLWYIYSSGWVSLVGNALGITGMTTYQLTVPASAVNGSAMFKCVLTDSDSAHGGTGQTYSDTLTINDFTDSLSVTIQSSAGDVFKNGVGSSTLTGKVFQNGAEIDSGGTGYTRVWSSLSSVGAQDWFRSSCVPDTTITGAITAGSTTTVAFANVTGLAIGDTCIIDPGLSSEEVFTVSNIVTLTVSKSTAFATSHIIGARVIRVAGSAATATTIGAAMAIDATAITLSSIVGLKVNDVVVIDAGTSKEEYFMVTACAASPITVSFKAKIAHSNGATFSKIKWARAGLTTTVSADDVTVKNTFVCVVS